MALPAVAIVLAVRDVRKKTPPPWKKRQTSCDIVYVTHGADPRQPCESGVPQNIGRPDETSGVVVRPSCLLIERAKRRDGEALVLFFRKHERRLHHHFAGPLHWHGDLVPDLVQETITRAIKAFPQLRGNSEAQAERWLFGIARNVHLQEISRQVGIRLRLQVARDLTAHFGRASEVTWLRSDIAAALGQLPLSQLEALRLLLRGLTTAQIAERLDVAEGTVASRIHRARARLRQQLGIGW